MRIPGVHIETLVNPAKHSREELDAACTIALALNRGRLVLAPPRDRDDETEEPGHGAG